MVRGYLEIFKLISRKYSYNMLNFLKDKTLRFRDFKEVCNNEKMMAQRLREFEQLGLVDINVKRIGRRPVSLYKLSERGKILLKLINDFKDNFDLP